MFTGIIEEVGTVTQITHQKDSAVLTICAKKVLEGTKIGESIAVNGICLTVTSLTNDSFTADVMHETLRRSSLAQIINKSHVNLERAMTANGRFGGHIVSGHVDGIGTITNIQQDSIAIWFTIQAPPELMRYIVEKGSITIDGISLTVAKVSNTDFSISAIPPTVAQTFLGERKVGSIVNLETDIIGKYVERLLAFNEKKAPESTITKDLLSRYGFT